jgi:hypothetical protein
VSCDALADVLVQHFQVSSEMAKRDARDFLDSLSALAAIEILDGPDQSSETAGADLAQPAMLKRFAPFAAT